AFAGIAGTPYAAFTTAPRASWSSLASASLTETTRRPPPSSGTRTMISRPSFTASIGPSPVLGFMAAMRLPFVGGLPLQSIVSASGEPNSGVTPSGDLPIGVRQGEHVVDPPPLPGQAQQQHRPPPHARAGQGRGAPQRRERYEQTEDARLREEHRQQVH